MKTPTTITIETIQDKATKRGGVVKPGRVREGHRAEIVPGKSITLFGVEKTTRWEVDQATGRGRVVPVEIPFRRTFALGDVVLEHSYNMAFFGQILGISDKRITVSTSRRNGDKARHMTIYDFDSLNWDLDLAREHERNANWSD